MTNPFRPRQFLPGLLNADVPVPVIDPLASPLAAAGNGPIAGYTNTFKLNLVNFDWITWHDYEWENWIVVDALLNAAIGFLNIQGIWKPATDYLAGQSVFDPADVNILYRCETPHTSGTDFDAEKPLYWSLIDAAEPPVSSVFGRIGDVVALIGDYAAFYADKAATEAHIARVDNPHQTSWTTLVGKPASFPPAAHTHDEEDITNLDKYTQAEVDAKDAALLTNINTRVLKGGDTMTGFLLLHAAPTALLHAATKGYVDQEVATKLSQTQANALYLQLLGGTLTGFLTLHANPTSALHASTKGYVDTEVAKRLALVGGTMTGFLTLSGAPTIDLHAATKKYVDDNAGGGGAATHVGDTPPLAPEQGQLWFKTAEPVGMYVWYVDADSSQWVQTNADNAPVYASTAEARAGLVADKVMSPALVQARNGTQTKALTGLTTVTFDQVPAEANELSLIFNNAVYPANGSLRFDFSGAPAARAYSVRNRLDTTYVSSGGEDNNTSYLLDTAVTAQGLSGLVQLVRDSGPGNMWVVGGSLRRSSTAMLVYSGVFNMNGELVGLPRVFGALAFTAGWAICRWRV